jgi:hypothetical protein
MGVFANSGVGGALKPFTGLPDMTRLLLCGKLFDSLRLDSHEEDT